MAKVSVMLIVLISLGSGVLAQGLLPELPYPGGYTFLRYEIRAPGKAALQWTLEVIPEDDSYEVKMAFVRKIPASERFSLFGVYMGVDMMGAEDLPLASLFSVWDKEIEPGKSYFLRKRARLVTEGEAEILGIPVITGIYLHPDHPDLRAVVYIPRLSHRALVLFPPYFRVEKKEGDGWGVVEEIELVEFAHEG